MQQLNGKIKIAVQSSGRLSEASLSLLSKMGLEFESYENRLTASCRNLPVDLLFLRDDDIPEYVQDGVADLGIVGGNLVHETGARVKRLLDLDFGFCSLVVAVPEADNADCLRSLQGQRIATSHRRILKEFLDRQGIEATIVPLRGSVEIAPALQVADAVCDLTSTGSTLRTNRLRVVETLSDYQAQLIRPEVLDPAKGEWVEKLILRARGVQDARHYKYVMFNAPESALDQIKGLLPGCQSPTVVRLAEPGYIAVHSTVLEETFWELVEKVRECGGRDILVAPVEKFIQ